MNSRMKIKKAYEYMKSFHQHDTTDMILHMWNVSITTLVISLNEKI